MQIFFQDIDTWILNEDTEEHLELCTQNYILQTFTPILVFLETTITKIKQRSESDQRYILERSMNLNKKLKLTSLMNVPDNDTPIKIHLIDFVGTIIMDKVRFDEDHLSLVNPIKKFCEKYGDVKMIAPSFPDFEVLPVETSVKLDHFNLSAFEMQYDSDDD